MANGFVLPITTTPQPVPIAPQGSTLVNVGTAQLSLCQTPTFASNVFTLTTKASLPWPSGPLYAKVANGSGSIMLLQGLYNLYNPNIVINSGTITAKIGGTVDVTIKNATLNVNAGVVEVENATGKILTTGGYSERLYASKVKEPHAFSITVTPGGKLWAALMVVVRPLTSGTKPYCAQASIGQYVYQASPRAAITGLLAASFAPSVGGAATFTAIIPVEGLVKTGTLTKIVVGIYTSAASTETYVIMIFGLSKNPGMQLRPDGRAYPLGSQVAGAAVAGLTSVTLITAPATPLRVILRSLTIAGNWQNSAKRATVRFAVQATIGGNTQAVLNAIASGTGGGGGTADIEWESGLLCDPDTAVTCVISSMNGTPANESADAYAIYDLVV